MSDCFQHPLLNVPPLVYSPETDPIGFKFGTDLFKKKLKISVSLHLPNLSEAEKKSRISISARLTVNEKAGTEIFKKIHSEKDPIMDMYGPFTLEIPFGKPKNLPHDARIYIEVFSATKDSDYRSTPVRNGTNSVYIKELKENPGGIEIDLQRFQLNAPESEISIGTATIKVLNKELLNNLTFREKRSTDIIESNLPTIKKSLMEYGQEYNETFKNRKNTVQELDAIGFPYENEEVLLPGKMLFKDITQRDPENEENFIGNLFQIALDRKGKTSEWFSKTINGKLMKGIYDNDVTEACEVLGKTTTNLATMRSYKPDRLYFKGKMINVEDMNPIPERLDEVAGEFSATDCEDSECSILNIGRRIQEGEFKNPTLKDLRKLSRFYVFSGCLASIQESRLSDSDKYSSNEVYVGQDVSGKVKIGAHMFALGINYPRFKKMVKRGPNPPDANLLTWDLDNSLHDVGEKLPELFLEGTGDLNPLIHPPQCYSDDPKIQNEKRVGHYGRTTVQNFIDSNLSAIGSGIIEKIPIHREDKPGIMPIFYRYIAEVYTDSFNETGDCFVFSDGRTRGIDVRSLSLKSNLSAQREKEPYYREPTLEMIPRENKKDKEIFMNLRRQLPIYPIQTVTQGKVERVQSSITFTGVKRFETVDNFNEAAKKITSNRTPISPQGKLVRVVSSHRNDELFNKVKQDGSISLINAILKDIHDTDSVINAEAKMKYFSNHTHGTDIEFVFDPSLIGNDVMKVQQKLRFGGNIIMNDMERLSCINFQRQYDVREFDAEFLKTLKEKGEKAIEQGKTALKKGAKGLKRLIHFTNDLRKELITKLEESDDHKKEVEKAKNQGLEDPSKKVGYGFIITLLKQKEPANEVLDKTHKFEKVGFLAPFLRVHDIEDIESVGNYLSAFENNFEATKQVLNQHFVQGPVKSFLREEHKLGLEKNAKSYYYIQGTKMGGYTLLYHSGSLYDSSDFEVSSGIIFLPFTKGESTFSPHIWIRKSTHVLADLNVRKY